MKVGASKAAKIANVARSTIYKDMDDGTLSFTINSKGNKSIDISELERVYGTLNTSDNNKMSEDVSKGHIETAKKDSSDNALSREIKLLHEQIARIDQMNERERERLEKQIEDLKEDRNKWREQSNKLLLTYEADKKEQHLATKQKPQSDKYMLWVLPLFTILLILFILLALGFHNA